jgi:hypothetical protein
MVFVRGLRSITSPHMRRPTALLTVCYRMAGQWYPSAWAPDTFVCRRADPPAALRPGSGRLGRVRGPALEAEAFLFGDELSRSIGGGRVNPVEEASATERAKEKEGAVRKEIKAEAPGNLEPARAKARARTDRSLPVTPGLDPICTSPEQHHHGGRACLVLPEHRARRTRRPCGPWPGKKSQSSRVRAHEAGEGLHPRQDGRPI